MRVVFALPDSHHRMVDGMLTNATEERAATRLVSSTMKPNRDARLILNAVTWQLVATFAAEIGPRLGFHCVTAGVPLVGEVWCYETQTRLQFNIFSPLRLCMVLQAKKTLSLCFSV